MHKFSKTATAAAMATILVGTAGVTTAMAWEDGPRGCKRGGKMGAMHKGAGPGVKLERLAERLNMSEDQRVQIASATAAVDEQIQANRDAMRSNREALREAMGSNPVNEAEVEELAVIQGDLKTEMILLRAQHKSTVNAFLTDEQRAQLQEMRDKRGQRRGHQI